jgi:hypothetical protein
MYREAPSNRRFVQGAGEGLAELTISGAQNTDE